MKDLMTDSNLYDGVGEWILLFQHCALKVVNEAIVEGMGSVLDRHCAGGRHLPIERCVARGVCSLVWATVTLVRGFFNGCAEAVLWPEEVEFYFEGRAWPT